jgi:hypothetical protein
VIADITINTGHPEGKSRPHKVYRRIFLVSRSFDLFLAQLETDFVPVATTKSKEASRY